MTRQRQDRIRLLAIGVFLLLTFVLAYSLNYPSLAVIKGDIRRIGFFAPLVFIFVYTAATLFFVPKNLLSIVAGAVFGLVSGIVFVLIGATLGSVIAFLGARQMGRSAVERLSGRKIARLDNQLVKKPFSGILIARLIPIVPFTLLNYAAGLSGVGFISYVGATVLGMLPGTWSYVALGAYGIHLRTWEFSAAALAFVAFLFLTRVLVRRSNG